MAQINETLCDHCHGIFSSKESRLLYKSHHESELSIAPHAIDFGCPLCLKIWNFRLRNFSSRVRVGDKPNSQHIKLLWSLGDPAGFLTFREQSGERLRKLAQLRVIPYKDHLRGYLRVDFPQNTSDENVLRRAKYWVEDCHNKHRGVCDTSSAKLPSRLISIGDDAGTAPDMLKLRLLNTTDSLASSTQYTTLSHRWGQSRFLRLTSSNLSSLSGNIEWSSLPVVFQEAIVVTRYLGIRFIWIDSLCIIQDSDSDWIREASTMCNVYKNSYCNIAASSSRGDSTQLFWDRDITSLQPLEVSLRKSAAHRWNPDNHTLRFETMELFENGPDKEPLAQRGWVFQERLLSRCTIHFTDSQVFFECSQSICCEMYPKGTPVATKELRPIVKGLLRGSQQSVVSARVSDSAMTYIPFPTLLELYRVWGYIVTDYCETDLTKEQDKLIAVSGLAREMSKHMKTSYYAGLWENRLTQQLLWSADPSSIEKAPPSPQIYRAPTWSWASLNTYRIFPYPLQNCCRYGEDMVTILDVHTVGADPFGRLDSSFIRLQGHLNSVRIAEDPYDLNKTAPEATDDQDAPRHRLGTVMRCRSLRTTRVKLDRLDYPDLSARKVHECYAIPLFGHLSDVTHEYNTVLDGILVERLQSSGESSSDPDRVYVRIGVFSFAIWPHARESKRQQCNNIAETMCNPGSECVVKLV